MWQASFDDITATYSEVFELLRQVSTVVIVGNHDEGLLKIAAALHFEVLPSLKLVNTYLHHGHVFDPVNSSKWMWVGREATKIAGWIEKLGYKDIDKDYDKLKERIRPRDPKSEVDYVEANAKLAVLLGVKTMIFGHTHEALDKYYQLPGREPIHILNCGTWVDGKRDYIEFDYEAKTFNLLVWKERSGTN
jgi:UDP-2,3-diacylglucosamine pyrophosphatase LpxH